MVILGISGFYHDAAAALLIDGRLAAAAQEERFSRLKHDPGFPSLAIDACLRTAGVSASDVELVAFYEKPLLKLDRVLETSMAVAPRGIKRWAESLPSWFIDKLRARDRVREQLNFQGRFIYAGHHESHAASAFFLSPFEEAATLTTDGVGEWTTNAIGVGRGNRLELTHEIRFPHSLGLLYSAFTQYLGFEVNEGEYKVMGLAPYGEPRFVQTILDHMIALEADGSYRLDMRWFDYLHGDSTISACFGELFGRGAREPSAPIEAFHMDVARSIQAVCELVVMRQAEHTRSLTGMRHLCLAGGVALNSVANGKLIASGLFEDVWIQPAAGDAGGSVGAALVAWHHVLGQPRTPPIGDGMSGAYLGPKATEAEIHTALAETALTSEELDDDTLVDRVATLLAEGAVVGWLHGRMEFGPRALGARSILADPRGVEVQPRVNAKIKFREGFRPFAPAVPLAHAKDWFELSGTSPYMLLVVPVADAQLRPLSEADAAMSGLDRLWVDRSSVQAVTHVDNSARVQTVDGVHNPRFHALLERFGAKTGCPVLLNTSFNLKGEPIVSSPLDAARTFIASGMDALVLENHLVLRPPDRPPTGVLPPRPVVEKITPARTLRVFGLGGGALMGLLAALQLRLDHQGAAIGFGLFAAALAIPGALAPESLRPVERTLARLTRPIGKFQVKLLLSLVYLVVLTPTALVRRAIGGRPLESASSPTSGQWLPVSNHPDEPARYDRMF